MASYVGITSLVTRMSSNSPNWQLVVTRLTDIWLDDFDRRMRSSNVVETASQGFSYLFDLTQEVLIAAWGVSQGWHGGARDARRMAGHPLSAGALYHRGHAIPHTLGGGTDINLVTQLGRINIGPFRPLEKQAVATPGSFYFTYWTYQPATFRSQTPSGVDQGLLIAGQQPDIRHHGN